VKKIMKTFIGGYRGTDCIKLRFRSYLKPVYFGGKVHPFRRKFLPPFQGGCL